MVVGIAAAMEVLACFVLSEICLFYFLFWEKGWGGALAWVYFVKLSVWLVVVVEIAIAVEFVTRFFYFWDFLVYFLL